MYPMSCGVPNFYGLPKIHKPDTPIRPIVSSCGSVTYGMAKELKKILNPLVGKSPHHINSIQGQKGNTVTALFTSVSMDLALGIIKVPLEKTHPQGKNSSFSWDIVLVLEFCLKKHLLPFQGQFYEQVEGAAMGSPVSPIVANLYMEYFEQKALCTDPTTRLLCKYVDDTFVIQREENKQNFQQHINSVDLAIQFTVKNNKEDGAIPFLGTIVKNRLMVSWPLLYIGNLHTWTNIYSGTATSISQQNTL